MYHFVLWCIFRNFAVTLSFLDCYLCFSHILNDTLRSVPHILREFENRDLGNVFQVFRAFSCNLSWFIEINGLFEKKQRVVLPKTTRHSFYFKGHFSN